MAKKQSGKTEEKVRCGWVGTTPHFIPYHDEEWGVPVHDDHRHFEMLILEGAQAGLSWSTILLRREGYRKAFAKFDPVKVARFDERKQATLLNDSGIIRNRLKIKSAITNAKAFLEIQKEFGSFNTYIWQFVQGQPKINSWKDMSQVPATTSESDALSKDLKKRGFSFVGSTVIYAHMQAAGLVNDHTIDCFRHPSNIKGLTNRRNANKRPSLNIQLKRIYAPPSPKDGVRILVDRLWPRGLSKEAASLDHWLRDVAPSTALRQWFNHQEDRWQEFSRRYARELDDQPEAIHKLRTLASTEQITLLFSTAHLEHNNALALLSYLKRDSE